MTANDYTPGQKDWLAYDSKSEAPPRQYSGHESVFAWLCMLAGYLVCRYIPVWEKPLGGFLLILFLFSAAFFTLRHRQVRLTALPVAAAISAIVISLALVCSANAAIHFCAYAYALAVYLYFLHTATGNAIKAGFNDFIAMDFFKALFVTPFYSFGHLFKAMFSGKAAGTGKFLLKVFVGIAIAVIPTVVVIALLSYDADFSKLLSRLLDFDAYEIFMNLMRILFGIPIGMYLFGAFVSAVDGKCRQVITEESCTKAAGKIQIMPAISVLTAVLPLLFLYVVFFISQWSYYISGFTGVLPENFSYAQYARNGFFQLCAVSVINLLVILSILSFMRRKNRQADLLYKGLILAFCVFTLILISTALAKLFLYINIYGLTPRRLYAAWFMVVLAVVFLLIAIKQFVRKLRVTAISLVALSVLFAALALPNTDGYIAKYNVDRYVAGTLDTVDLEAMEDLGVAAVPQVVRLATILEQENPEATLCAKSRALLQKIQRDIFDQEDTLLICNVPYLQAKAALESYLPKK